MYNVTKRNIFKHFHKTCYIASKLESTYDEEFNEITQYDTPKKYVFNIQPLITSSTDGAEIQAFGESAFKMKIAVITERDKYAGKFHEFDLAYLDGATPTNEAYNGEKANYRINLVSEQNAIIRIFFTKIIE